MHIILITDGIANDEAQEIGTTAMHDLQTVLATAHARHGDQARIGVVTMART